VERFEFAGFESLWKIHGHDLDRQSGEAVEGLAGLLFATFPPEPVEDLAEIHDRHENVRLLQRRCVQ